jgi:hypothetical protein
VAKESERGGGLLLQGVEGGGATETRERGAVYLNHPPRGNAINC